MSRLSIIVLFSILATTFGFRPLPDAVLITGKVTAADTGKPIHQAHVFIIDGEEEALTTADGSFRIESWQKLPVRLTVQRKGYSRETISVASTKPVSIRLSPSR